MIVCLGILHYLLGYLEVKSSISFGVLKWADEVSTVGKNIIATIKIRNNYGAIQSFTFPILRSNIGLYSIAPCKVITLDPLCILFGISSLLLSLSKVIALPTIAIVIVVALSRS